MVALSLTLSLGLAACQQAPTTEATAVVEGNDSAIMLTGPQAAAEYDEEKTRLSENVPEAATWPDPPQYEPDETYEAGFGASDAGFDWQCIWLAEFSDARGQDPDRESQALDALEDFFETPAFESFDPESQEIERGFYEDAVLGDAGMLQQSFETNC